MARKKDSHSFSRETGLPSAPPKSPEIHVHGPDNAEHELKKAYNAVMDAAVIHFWDRKGFPGVNPHEVITLYRHAFRAHRSGDRLAAERWARSAKHLARAFVSEAKIAYLEPRASELPYLKGASPSEYDLHEREDTTTDLLNSVAEHIPPGMDQMPPEMTHYLSRARRHLQVLEQPDYTHELLRAERIKAAHEYGRVLECMALAYEAQERHGGQAA